MDTNNHILDIIKLIDKLQKEIIKHDIDNNEKNTSKYNTRPFTLFLCNSTPLTIAYSNGESNIFRVERINGDCVTVRLLEKGENDTLTSTSEYATINIGCISAIKCLYDVCITL